MRGTRHEGKHGGAGEETGLHRDILPKNGAGRSGWSLSPIAPDWIMMRTAPHPKRFGLLAPFQPQPSLSIQQTQRHWKIMDYLAGAAKTGVLNL
jgi:hypothetical protein